MQISIDLTYVPTYTLNTDHPSPVPHWVTSIALHNQNNTDMNPSTQFVYTMKNAVCETQYLACKTPLRWAKIPPNDTISESGIH